MTLKSLAHRSSFTVFFVISVLLALLAATPVLADWQTGVDAYKTGDFATAEVAFRQLAETQPEWYGGHFMLGRVLLERGQPVAALTALERAHQLEARPDVALLLARTAIDENKTSLARDALSAEPPSQLPVEQKVAWLSLRASASGDAFGRLRDLEAAAKLAPKDLGLRISAADAAVEAKRLGDAVRHLELAKELSPADEVVLYRLLKVRVSQSDAAGEDEKASTCVRTAEAAADLAAVTGKASHLSVAGQSYLCADDLDRAASYFGRALAAEPTSGRAYDLAKVELKQQKWESAEATLRPYLDTQGEDRSKIHQGIGRALEGQQLFLEAIPHYEIAGDSVGIAHAKEGQAALEHNEKKERYERELEKLADQIGELEKQESGLR